MSRVTVSTDGNVVGLTSITDQEQFVSSWKTGDKDKRLLRWVQLRFRSSEPRDLAAGKNGNKSAAAPEVGLMTSSSRAGAELKVARDERKLSLTIPGEEHRAKVHQFPRGSCDL